MNKYILHDKYVTIMISRLDVEDVGDFSKVFIKKLRELISEENTDEGWVRRCECAISSAVELLNLALGFGIGELVPTFALDIILSLSDLNHSIKERGVKDREELLYIEHALDRAGRNVLVRDPKYWLLPCAWFDLDPDGRIAAKLEKDLKS